MWHTLQANTPLYRVTRSLDTWANVLQGYGAFFSTVGRYNGTRQQTVYATNDPMVALSEWGWHAALASWEVMGDDDDPKKPKPLTYPLSLTAKLWRFCLSTDVTLIDVATPTAAQHFGYPCHAPFNPHPDRYSATQRIANEVSDIVTAPAPFSRPEGIFAPSVRTPHSAAYMPRQMALFVYPSPAVVHATLAQRATLLGQWDVELEFTPDASSLPVTPLEARIAWLRPKVRLTGPGPVPKFAGRPRSKPIADDVWHTLTICCSPH